MRAHAWSTVAILVRFLRPVAGRAAIAVGLGFLTVAASVAMMATSGYLIAAAALRPPTILLLWVPIVGVRFFGLARAAFRYLERLVSHDVTFHILAGLRVWLYERIEPNHRLLADRRSAEVLDAAVADVDRLQHLYLRAFFPPLVGVLVGLGMLAWLGRYGPWLAVAWGFGALTAAVAVPWWTHRWTRRGQLRLDAVRSARMSAADELLRGLLDGALPARTAAVLAELERLERKEQREQARQGWLQGASDGLFVFVTQATMAAVLWVGMQMFSHGRLAGVLLPAIALGALASFEAVAALPAAFQQFAQVVAAGERLLRLAQWDAPAEAPGASLAAARAVALAAEPADKTAVAASKTAPVATPAAVAAAAAQVHAANRRGGAGVPALRVRGLCVRYGPGEPYVLKDVDVDLDPGKRLAIVGESGAGKTTFLHVLLGFLPYEAGSITLAGRELRAWPAEDVRAMMAVVPQRGYLFHTTVEHNLRLAKPDASREELEQALRIAQVYDVIARLPDGYATVIGETGALLSGGERQRLALARALLAGAPILLCDEPTSALDSVTEQAFIEAFFTAAAGKSVVWVTHRLAGMERMDEIVVLRGGRIIERGTHRELIARGGWYAQMWRLEREMAADMAAKG